MTIEQYQELTGITVPESQIPLVTAQIRRTQSILENMLGYSLDKSKAQRNYYEELGKTDSDFPCDCFSIPEDLQPPDEVQGAVRLFDYNNKDRFFSIDPFTRVYSVKLVFIKTGEDENGITLKTLDEERIRVQKGRDGFSKFIERCKDCFCECECKDCVQLAVDADWMFEGCLPDDLLYLWTDMIGYYVDCKKDIKSETLGSHSYTKFDNNAPQTDSESLAILNYYAGPHGSLSTMPV